MSLEIGEMKKIHKMMKNIGSPKIKLIKLFSTSRQPIPITLKTITTPVIINIEILLLIETLPKKEVIFELLFSLIFMPLLDMKLKRAGSKVNVIIKDVINPKVIIQPKSTMGLIPLKTKDKKAHMVVRTV